MCCEDQPHRESMDPRDESTRILRRLRAGLVQLRAMPDLRNDDLVAELDATLRDIESELGLR